MKAVNGKWKISLFFALFFSVLMLQGTEYGQDKSKDKDNAYKKVARDLTSRLSKRVNLTKDQSGKVQDILVDYQKDISDKWNDRSMADNSGNKKDLTNDLRDADKKANDKIEKALSGNELSSYISSKKEWWAKIKDRVYSKDFMDLVNYKEEDDNATVGNAKKSKKDNADKSDNNDLSRRFEPYAKMMATELMQKLNLSLQQAADIQDALVDYQKSVADIRQKSMGSRDENVRVADNTGRRNENRSDNVVGSNRRNENMSEFRDIDNSANDKIVNVLEDNQKSKYERVKTQWWKEVKDRVYAEVKRENRNVSGKTSK
ncbi:MAG: hypothetical protein Q8933_07755 [Bacteroidota bacterium]|nr:hypothetical protein [Bacteroidota bacterium]MDP4195492.1 hypothetical protein [Bacteroidota bacterium]